MATLRMLALTSVLVVAQPVTSQAQATTPILAIKEVADMLGGIGDALGKLTEGVQKMVVAGDNALSTLSARRAHASLVELSRLTTGLAARQRLGAIPALEQYLRAPSPRAWIVVGGELGGVLVEVDSLLTRLNRDKSDLVLQPVYAKLETALRARVTLLSRLTSAPPPATKAELAELRNVLARYRILVAQLESARDELNEYARAAKSAAVPPPT